MNDPEFDPYLPPRAPVGFEKERKATGEDVPGGHPLLTIWLRPRATIRGIVDAEPTYLVIPLAMLAGFGNVLTRSFQSQGVAGLPVAGLLIGCLIAGFLSGIIGVYLTGLLARWTGGWLGGTASAGEVRAALAWSSVPQVALLPILLLTLAVLGEDFFREGGVENVGTKERLLVLIMSLSLFVLGIWSFILNIKCVAEVHRFSAWRGFGTLLLVGVVLVAIVLLCVALAVGIMTAMKA